MPSSRPRPFGARINSRPRFIEDEGSALAVEGSNTSGAPGRGDDPSPGDTPGRYVGKSCVARLIARSPRWSRCDLGADLLVLVGGARDRGVQELGDAGHVRGEQHDAPVTTVRSGHDIGAG